MLKNKKHLILKKWRCYVGGKRLPPGERKEHISFRMKQKYIEELKKIPKYMEIVEKLVVEYLEKNKN